MGLTTVVIAMAMATACGLAVMARAQDRMPPIPADKMTEVQRQAVAEFKAARAVDLGGPFIPLLRSPEVMNRARAMGDYLRYKSALPPRLSEFVILLTARRWTQQYEWNAHQPLALKGGLSPDIVAAIADGRRPLRMADDEAIVYTLCEELQRNQSVSDETYARALAISRRSRRDRHARPDGLLHDAGDGDEHGADAAPGRRQAGARAVPAVTLADPIDRASRGRGGAARAA